MQLGRLLAICQLCTLVGLLMFCVCIYSGEHQLRSTRGGLIVVVSLSVLIQRFRWYHCDDFFLPSVTKVEAECRLEMHEKCLLAMRATEDPAGYLFLNSEALLTNRTTRKRGKLTNMIELSASRPPRWRRLRSAGQRRTCMKLIRGRCAR